MQRRTETGGRRCQNLLQVRAMHTVAPTPQTVRKSTVAVWLLILAAWLTWLPNAMGLRMADGTWPSLWMASPLFGIAALAVACWLRSWKLALASIILGIGASYLLIEGTYLLEALSHA